MRQSACPRVSRCRLLQITDGGGWRATARPHVPRGHCPCVAQSALAFDVNTCPAAGHAQHIAFGGYLARDVVERWCCNGGVRRCPVSRSLHGGPCRYRRAGLAPSVRSRGAQAHVPALCRLVHRHRRLLRHCGCAPRLKRIPHLNVVPTGNRRSGKGRYQQAVHHFFSNVFSVSRSRVGWSRPAVSGRILACDPGQSRPTVYSRRQGVMLHGYTALFLRWASAHFF